MQTAHIIKTTMPARNNLSFQNIKIQIVLHQEHHLLEGLSKMHEFKGQC